MKGSRRSTAALVVAITALVVALAGTGYAALSLPRNSVGAKQLKKNSVTGAKVKNRTLTGKDINLKKLGTVPAASHASTADTASALSPPEALHLIGAPGEAPFLNGAKGLPSEEGIAFQKAGYYKDHEGIVHLQGIVLSGKGGGISSTTPIFQLPPGYRPTAGTLLVLASGPSELLIGGGGTTIKGVNLEGDVLGQEETTVLLDGISFRAES